MSDQIDRRAAIDAMAELQGRASTKAELKGISKAWKRIKQLPPIQPEIIRCKDCKHLFNKDNEGGKCWHFNGFSKVVSYDDFCSRAERRTDERSD